MQTESEMTAIFKKAEKFNVSLKFDVSPRGTPYIKIYRDGDLVTSWAYAPEEFSSIGQFIWWVLEFSFLGEV